MADVTHQAPLSSDHPQPTPHTAVPDSSDHAQSTPQTAGPPTPQKDGQENHETGKSHLGLHMKEHVKPKGKPAGGFDSTPLPDAPQGYTVRFVFHSAANLPPADLNTASSDPFLTATLKTSVPKRNPEDPDLTHRTKTIRRTLEPNWEDEWIVANVPASGFELKCRLYDEDVADKDDRLGNVTIKVPHVDEDWKGIPGQEFEAKKRMMSKRAFLVSGLASLLKHNFHITPRLNVSIEVIGKSDPPYAQMYTVGPATWIKHYSPMIGRLAGTKVNHQEENEVGRTSDASSSEKKSNRYDFQANEMQLSGPVPPELYHRYVEFKAFVNGMFASTGLRGKILNKALHKQHSRVYNFDRSTESGDLEPNTKDATLQFLKLAHFDEGGRTFTYVLTLDGLLRFTETGKEFGIDLLSKHTMHSDVARYIACSGEFLIRRLQHADASDDPEPGEETHPKAPMSDGPPNDRPPQDPQQYQLVIDNDSGTYRPDKSILPLLKKFLQKNFPGLGIVAMHWEEQELQDIKKAQLDAKKREGKVVNLVQNRSQSSISSAESDLDGHEGALEHGKKSKREAAFAAVEDPHTIKDSAGSMLPHRTK